VGFLAGEATQGELQGEFYQNLVKDWTCGSIDMFADRHTDKQTRSPQILRSHGGGGITREAVLFGCC